VTLLVSRSRRKPQFLCELHEKEIENAALVDRVEKAVIGFHKSGSVFTNVE
jgi:hypothetical protein